MRYSKKPKHLYLLHHGPMVQCPQESYYRLPENFLQKLQPREIIGYKYLSKKPKKKVINDIKKKDQSATKTEEVAAIQVPEPFEYEEASIQGYSSSLRLGIDRLRRLNTKLSPRLQHLSCSKPKWEHSQERKVIPEFSLRRVELPPLKIKRLGSVSNLNLSIGEELSHC